MAAIDPELFARYDVPGPRYTSYPTVPVWTDALTADQFSGVLADAAKTPDAPLSLYVHLPFCKERCTFCGCNVVISKDTKRADFYIDRLERELEMLSERLGGRRTLAQIHWGGGTPTFLEENQILRLFAAIT